MLSQWCRACEAGPSLHRVGEAGVFVLAIAPRRVIRVEHEPVGAAERPATELAAARCLLTTRWFTRAILHKEKYLILSLETALRPSA
jgi:hypothetical protein